MKRLLLLSSFTLLYLSGSSQFLHVKEYVDIGNIKALMGAQGNLWIDSTTLNANCEFPKGSGKHIGNSGSLWMAGFHNGALKAAAGLFTNEVDYSPGPIVDINNPVASAAAQAQRRAKVWKVNRTEINSFLATSIHTKANTPASVLDWPGRGNVHATDNTGAPLFSPMNDYNRDFAPFIDVNSDGLYDPLAGDYPDIVADQGLWTVFNDVAKIHDLTKSEPLGVEVQLLAYAYNRGSLADNIIFYNYKIINRVGNPLDSFFMGFFADMDLGYSFDDYVGYDSSRNLGIIYNGDNNDGTGLAGQYGNTIPMAGVQVLKMPGMDCTQFKAASSFLYFSNAAAGVPSALQEPTTATDFYHYLTGSFKNGQHLKNDYSGPGVQSNGLGSGPDANYVFSGDISNPTTWSECASANMPHDRKMITASKVMTLSPGSAIEFSVALVASAPKVNNGCPTATFAAIREVADTATKIFCNPLPISTATTHTGGINKTAIQLYPNPAKELLYVTMPEVNPVELSVFDVIGRKMEIQFIQNGNNISILTAGLPNGLYTLRLQAVGVVHTGKFVKE